MQTEVDDHWGLSKIQAPAAWDTFGSSPTRVLIATVDTGIDSSHSEFGGKIWNNPGETPGNSLDDDGNGYVDDTWGWDFYNQDNDPSDDNMHGTYVSSIAAAAEDGTGVAGVCPWCELMAVKVLGASGSGTLDAVADGITYAADNGARVINLSLAGPVPAQTLEDAVDYAWTQGSLVVAAAGNDGAETKVYPAAYANAMSVASTNIEDYRSCFSNYSEGYISVAAPGEAILGAVPGGGYETHSGTSAAAPHASGLGGLLFSQDQTRTNSFVRGLIENSSEDLGPNDVDAYFGYGRINALRAVNQDTTDTAPPGGLFANDLSASGYAHARKLARDAGGDLHLVWHSQNNTQYQVNYATSNDGGATWSSPEIVFSSPDETYHPAIAVDEANIYVAFPSKSGAGPSHYRVYVMSKPFGSESWQGPYAAIDEPYDAVRPDLYYDPGSGKLHLIASSYDDGPNIYYSSSGNGQSWSKVKEVNVDPTGVQKTRYADIHAHGSNLYIAGRTIEFTFMGLIPRYRVFTLYSNNNGNSWSSPIALALHDGLLSGEYGLSLAGAADQLYLVYEHNGSIYFRSSVGGAAWSIAENLGGGAWPSISQADDGQAWTLWESGGMLKLRQFSGSSWDPAEELGAGNYPNLKLGTSGGLVEWTATHCSGAPFRLIVDSRESGAGPTPTPTTTYTPTPTSTPTPTLTNTPTPTSTPTPTPTHTPTPPAGNNFIHVGDLDSESIKLKKGNWKALVTITVHDANHNPLSGVIVSGTFTQNGLSIEKGCTTDTGLCTVDSDSFPSKSGKATFMVDSLAYPDLNYEPVNNHDPDGDSDGTTIPLSK
jgi:hypothetical protein